MAERITLDQWAMHLAQVTSLRSTCNRRKVGAVFLNSRGHVVATGYNGAARGQPHCSHSPDVPQGQHSECNAIHAEQNCIIQCHNVYDVATCYVTLSPCIVCCRMLLNTSCQRIVYLDPYTDVDEPRALWEGAGRIWERLIR